MAFPETTIAASCRLWYLFSALGFTRFAPAATATRSGVRYSQEVTAHLNKMIYPGGLLILKTVNNSDRNIYVKSIQVDGIDHKGLSFNHDTLVYGKTIVFKMDSQPAASFPTLGPWKESKPGKN